MHDFLDSVPEWTGISVVLGYVNFKISVTDTTQASLITENQYAPIVSSVFQRGALPVEMVGWCRRRETAGVGWFNKRLA